jgi:DUF971 family protein
MPTPQGIFVTKSKDTLRLEYAEEKQHKLRAEYLRVFSPSAEVRGHGKGQEVLQFGKRHVAIQITFSDGHNSGIFTWDYLYDLAENYTDYWIGYLGRLHVAGQSRDPDVQVVKLS